MQTFKPHKPKNSPNKQKKIKTTKRTKLPCPILTKRTAPMGTKSTPTKGGKTNYLHDPRLARLNLAAQLDAIENDNDVDQTPTPTQAEYDNNNTNTLSTPLPFSPEQLETMRKRSQTRQQAQATLAAFAPLVPTSTYQWTHLTHTMSKLDNYVVVELSGIDSTKVLHSITTQDITNFALNSYKPLHNIPLDTDTTLIDPNNNTQQEKNNTTNNNNNNVFHTNATHAAFLTSKGRMNYTAVISLAEPPQVADLSVLPTPERQVHVIKKTNQLELASKITASYHMVVPKAIASDLIKHIKDNSLRLKSKLFIRDDLDIYNVISPAPLITPSSASSLTNAPFDIININNDNNNVTILADPRPLPQHLAHHYIIAPKSTPLHSTNLTPLTSSSSSSQSQNSHQTQTPYTFSTSTIHDVFTTLYNLPNNTNGIIPGKSLPLEYNVDLGHGVNFNKGCYLGQELTSRTHHRGEIRKRAIPAFFIPLDVNNSTNLQESMKNALHMYNKLGKKLLIQMAQLGNHFDECELDLNIIQQDPNNTKELDFEDDVDNNNNNKNTNFDSSPTDTTKTNRLSFIPQHVEHTTEDNIPMKIFNYDLFDANQLNLIGTADMPESTTNTTAIDSRLPPQDSPIYHTIKMLMEQQSLLNEIKNPQVEEVNPIEFSPQVGDTIHSYDLSQHFTTPKGVIPGTSEFETVKHKQMINAVNDEVGAVLFTPSSTNIGTIQFRTDFFTKPLQIGKVSLPPTFVVTRKKTIEKTTTGEDGSNTTTNETIIEPVDTYGGDVWQCIPICPDYITKEVFAKEIEDNNITTQPQSV